MHRSPSLSRVKAGFTLVEMSVVLVIIAVIAGAAISVGLTRTEGAKTTATNKRLEAIENALAAFLVLNGYIPCPAQGSLAVTDANFGVTTDCVGTPATTQCTGTAGLSDCTNARVGIVPVATLGLSDEHAFDSWGRRITYAVDVRATNGPDFNSIVTTATNNFVGLTIANHSDYVRTDDAVVALVSHGANGHGAWLRGGGATRYTLPGAIGAAETDNARDPATELSFGPKFRQGAKTSDFDDQVRYFTKPGLISRGGGVLNTDICTTAMNVTCPVNTTITPKQGPIGCGTDYNCMYVQSVLAKEILRLCFRTQECSP